MSKRKAKYKHLEDLKKELIKEVVKIKCNVCNDVFYSINTKGSVNCPNCGNNIKLN